MTKEPKRLYRNQDKRIIAGVCAGIADYFNLDPVLVRLAFIVGAFIGGLGIIAYIAAWILVPKK